MLSSLTQITQARLIKLRWLSVAAMLVAALISPNILGSSDLMPRLLAFATFVGAINACLQLAIIFYCRIGEELPIFSPHIQLVFDLVCWGSYIYLSGGATNPLISVFLPLVAIGAMVLSKAQAWFLGGAAILAYTFLWRYYQPVAIADAQMATRLHLLGMWLVFVVSAIVVVWFILQMTQAVRERDTALAKAREQAIRDDWLISMGGLAAGAAHELSTPLGTLNILIDDWLADASLLPSQRSDFQLMRRQVETCKRALTQLTQRAGSPREAGLKPVAVAAELTSMAGAWQALNPTASMLIDISPTLEDQALSIDIAVERALTNLLDNALKAGAAQIVLSAAMEEQRLTILIEDDGPGIPETALQSFASGRPITSACGMGIGLLLSRTAIERQGGTLALQRLPNRGTRAYLFLPLNASPGSL